MSNIYVIGAGGVGSWLTPLMEKLAFKDKITLIDGDTLEEKNLDRQLFDEGQIGMSKAEALGRQYAVDHLDKFYDLGTIDHLPTDLLMVCVDNHPARVSALRACDMFQCSAIIMANERTSAEAYLYRHHWKDTRLDPRVRNPEMLTNHSGDPRAAAIGCTGEAQEQTPQLASANFMAASLGAWLYVLWFMEFPKLNRTIEPSLTYLFRMNMNGVERDPVGELEECKAH